MGTANQATLNPRHRGLPDQLDPLQNRFASVDPVKGNITEPMSMVQYLYVVDDPLRWVDPLGLMERDLFSDKAFLYSGTKTEVVPPDKDYNVPSATLPSETVPNATPPEVTEIIPAPAPVKFVWDHVVTIGLSAGYGIVVGIDYLVGAAANLTDLRSKIGRAIQDFELDPFGSISAIQNAAKGIPGVENAVAYAVEGYQDFIHWGTDFSVESYDSINDFLNEVHNTTSGVKDSLGDSYQERVGCPDISPSLQQTLDEVTAMPWGTRPDPSTYLPQAYIDQHLAQFRGGATKFISSPPKGGTFGGSPFFVLPSSVADQLIEQSHGDVRVLETFLGLDPGALGENPYRVDFPNPTGLHMATGNESGANQKWIAGGFTKSSFRGIGVPEAVIDPAPEGTYTGRPVWRK